MPATNVRTLDSLVDAATARVRLTLLLIAVAGGAALLLGDGLRLVAVGVVAGLAAAIGGTRFLRALLYEVEPTSLAEFGIATALLVVVTLLATLLPARRAARTHPALVLRGE